MNYQEVRTKAKENIGPHCKVCPECDGVACRGKIPGPGGKGTGSGFVRNYADLRKIRLVMDTVYAPSAVSTKTELFGKTCALPVFAAPIGAVGLHYSDAYTDLSYSAAVLEGCKAAGSAAFTGDGVKDEVYDGTIDAIKAMGGHGIPTIKPWSVREVIAKARKAEAAGAFAFAMDIDAAGLVVLAMQGKPVAPMPVEALREIASSVRLPFILKGVLTAEGAEKALAAGGLYVLATERHESRRIDNQLRGRSGRQGDPGASKFFLSLEDDLMRIFGSQRMDGMLQKLGLKDGEAIVHPWINKALEKAQQKVEARNYEIRKNILKYDNVLNDQRRVIFDQRREIMSSEDVSDQIADFREEVVETLVARHIPEKAYPEQWDVAGLHDEVERTFGVELPVKDWAKEEGIADEEVKERVKRAADEWMAAKVAKWGPDVMRYVEKSILLQSLDHLWREHLVMLEHLRQVVGLRGYAQRDPLNEYKAEAFSLFEGMVAGLREAVTAQLMRVEIMPQQPEDEQLPYMEAHHVDATTGEDELAPQGLSGTATLAAGNTAVVEAAARDPNNPATWGKVGRNELCPCGSGKKYKHCHGQYA